MEQLGHSDARLTLRIYARAMSSEAEERARLEALVEGDYLGHKKALDAKTAADKL
jgi:hypothetical protein